MASLRIWVDAARPRTLPASIAPVLVGTAVGATTVSGVHIAWWHFVLAIVVVFFRNRGTIAVEDVNRMKG